MLGLCLQQFSAADFVQRPGESPHDADMVGLGDELRCQGKEHVTAEDDQTRRKESIEGGDTAPFLRVIDQVIVNQGGRVQHLQSGGDGNRVFQVGIEHTPGVEGQAGAEPFTAGADNVPNAFSNYRAIFGNCVQQALFQAAQLVFNAGGE